jgi:hypothetical protein
MTAEIAPSIVVELTAPIAIIRFNRPELRNPLSIHTLQELTHVTAAVFPREDVQAVIFTGRDDVFASGANIRELGRLDPATALEFAKFGQDLFQRIAEAKQLTIRQSMAFAWAAGWIWRWRAISGSLQSSQFSLTPARDWESSLGGEGLNACRGSSAARVLWSFLRQLAATRVKPHLKWVWLAALLIP